MFAFGVISIVVWDTKVRFIPVVSLWLLMCDVVPCVGQINNLRPMLIPNYYSQYLVLALVIGKGSRLELLSLLICVYGSIRLCYSHWHDPGHHQSTSWPPCNY